VADEETAMTPPPSRAFESQPTYTTNTQWDKVFGYVAEKQ
jgi:hypothetical protein